MISTVLILILCFAIYAVVHSLLATLAVKALARRVFGPGADRWYRLAYNLFAVVTLLPIFLLVALLPDKILYIVPGPWRWLMLAGQGLAVIGLGASLWQTGVFHFVGLSQLLGGQEAERSLSVGGFYRRVRHPLYLFSLLFLWLTPLMSVNLLTTFGLMTIYFYVGSIYEEKRLLAEFGAAYEDYRRQVPRLIPLPGRQFTPSPDEA